MLRMIVIEFLKMLKQMLLIASSLTFVFDPPAMFNKDFCCILFTSDWEGGLVEEETPDKMVDDMISSFFTVKRDVVDKE